MQENGLVGVHSKKIEDTELVHLLSEVLDIQKVSKYPAIYTSIIKTITREIFKYYRERKRMRKNSTTMDVL